MKSTASFTPIRFGLLCVAVLGCLGLLLARVGWLQIASPDNLIKQEDMRSLCGEPVAVERGIISGREGRPLTVSAPVNVIWIDPQTTVEKDGVGYGPRQQTIAETLHLNLGGLTQRVQSHSHARFLYLARQINPEQTEWIDKLHLPDVYLCDESRRFYPVGYVATNLLGFINVDNQGIEGMEKSFNAQLTGKPGRHLVRKDKHDNIIENITKVPPAPVHNLQLNIGECPQVVIEDALNNTVRWNKAESGAAVSIKIDTGEILAMTSCPDFSPNNRDSTTLDGFRNRVVSDTFEPGLTVKPLAIMTVLQQRTVQPGSVVDTHPFVLDGHRIRDVGYYPELGLTEILQKSSSTGVSHLSLTMPVQHLLDTYQVSGFGESTGLGLTGGSAGLIPHRHYWGQLDHATFAFGYGLMVTLLQLAHVCATIGGFGIERPLSITHIDPPVIGTRMMPGNIVHSAEHMMESMALPGGSGTRAAVRNYQVAIKVGMAKKIGPDGRYIDKYVTYTAGVAPTSRPQFTPVVVMNDPSNGSYYGGMVSAPVFSQVMGDVLRLENVVPDGMPQGAGNLIAVHDDHPLAPAL